MSADSALIDASRDGNFSEIKNLVENKGANIETKDPLYKRTPLLWCAYNGLSPDSVRLAEFLISKGADMAATDDSGYTALHEATRWGYIKVVEFLVMNDTALSKAKTKDGKTALDLAIYHGHDNVRRVFEEGVANASSVPIVAKAADSLASPCSALLEQQKERREQQLKTIITEDEATARQQYEDEMETDRKNRSDKLAALLADEDIKRKDELEQKLYNMQKDFNSEKKARDDYAAQATTDLGSENATSDQLAKDLKEVEAGLDAEAKEKERLLGEIQARREYLIGKAAYRIKNKCVVTVIEGFKMLYADREKNQAILKKAAKRIQQRSLHAAFMVFGELLEEKRERDRKYRKGIMRFMNRGLVMCYEGWAKFAKESAYERENGNSANSIEALEEKLKGLQDELSQLTSDLEAFWSSNTKEMDEENQQRADLLAAQASSHTEREAKIKDFVTQIKTMRALRDEEKRNDDASLAASSAARAAAEADNAAVLAEIAAAESKISEESNRIDDEGKAHKMAKDELEVCLVEMWEESRKGEEAMAAAAAHKEQLLIQLEALELQISEERKKREEQEQQREAERAAHQQAKEELEKCLVEMWEEERRKEEEALRRKEEETRALIKEKEDREKMLAALQLQMDGERKEGDAEVKRLKAEIKAEQQTANDLTAALAQLKQKFEIAKSDAEAELARKEAQKQERERNRRDLMRDLDAVTREHLIQKTARDESESSKQEMQKILFAKMQEEKKQQEAALAKALDGANSRIAALEAKLKTAEKGLEVKKVAVTTEETKSQDELKAKQKAATRYGKLKKESEEEEERRRREQEEDEKQKEMLEKSLLLLAKQNRKTNQ